MNLDRNTAHAIAPVVPYWKLLEWSEERWNQFCDDERRRREGQIPDTGPVATATEWSVKIVELEHLRLEAGFVADMPERQDGILNRFITMAEIAQHAALDKMMDPACVSEMNIKDMADVARKSSDAALNLRNGSAAPQTNINFQDVRILVGMGKDFTGTFEPVEKIDVDRHE